MKTVDDLKKEYNGDKDKAQDIFWDYLLEMDEYRRDLIEYRDMLRAKLNKIQKGINKKYENTGIRK